MEAHALRYSQGYKAKKGYTFWEKDFDAMAYKTMLRQLISKWGIMSIELQNAFEQDSVIEQYDDNLLGTDVPELAPVTDDGQLTPVEEPIEAEVVENAPLVEAEPEPAQAPQPRRRSAAPKQQPGLDDL